MQANELVRQVKLQVENIETAERTGVESFVIDQLVILRQLLNEQPELEAGGE